MRLRNCLPRHPRLRLLSILAVGPFLTLALAGCGGGPAGSASTASGAAHAPLSSDSSGASTSSGQRVSATPGAGSEQHLLIKALQVNLGVKDTLKAADDIEAAITSADPKATTAGQDRTQTDDGQYTVTIRFSVQAALYPQVSHYLAGYAAAHAGKLINLHEAVQDVTGDVVDSQSRLSNLKGEQQRLQTLMAQAGSLADVLTIEQRLTDVEGQIESIETHLNTLTSQTTFYDVTVTLQPLSAASQTANQPWQPGQTLGDALAAALAFAELLATLAIWLAVFSVFIVPAGLVVLYIRRRLLRRAAPAPAAAR